MNKRNLLTGATTLVLLSLIVFLFISDTDRGTATTAAQIRTPEKQSTASLQHFSLAQMITNADKIFRGTVLDFEPGTVNVGGGTLPTVTYRFRVEQSFKGSFASKEGVQFVEITMLGNIKKQGAQGDVQKMAVLPTLRSLDVGSDYLMLMTRESSIGLSTPIGLGQGSFEIYSQDKQEWAKNEYNNAGLFDGPVRYDELAAQIQQGGE